MVGVLRVCIAAASIMVGNVLAVLDYQECMSRDMHFAYGQNCYQLIDVTGWGITHAQATGGCALRGAHLAVALSDHVRNEVAKLMPSGSGLHVALQQEPGDTTAGEIPMNNKDWFWHVDGLLHIPAEPIATNWADGEPNDGHQYYDTEEGVEQYGAVKLDPMGNGGVMFDLDANFELAGYVCQFRRNEAVLGLYAQDKMVTITGKMSALKFGVPTAEKCAIECYVDPACMGFNYMTTETSCQFVYDRPQDAASSILSEAAGTEVWVKQ